LSDKEASADHPVVSKLVLPALVMSRFSNQGPAILTSLLLIDIGLTFGVSVGVMAQIRTTSSVVAILGAFIVGIISLRFKHRSLLLTGLLLQTISAFGCSVAPDYTSMMIFYSLCGLGIAMVTPMGLTLVAEYYPIEKRSSAIGWILTGASLSYLIGSPAVGLLAGYGGWRIAFIGFVVVVSFLSFLLAYWGLPRTPVDLKPRGSTGSYLDGFKAIFTNRSADACLVGTAFSWACYQLSLLYGASFLRQRFLLTTGSVAVITIGSAAFFMVGTQSGGRLVKRVGRKPLVVLSALITAIFMILSVNLFDPWLCVATSYLGNLFSGMRFTSSSSLTLEQVPKYRGTMMSIASASDGTGAALGAGIGGWAILISGYGLAGIILGGLGLVSAIVFQLLAVDPTKAKGIK